MAVRKAAAGNPPRAQGAGPAKVAAKLKAQQQAFVEAYLTCWNATGAAKAAGYSAKTAYSQGSRLLRNAEVRKLIDERLKALGMGADEVLARLSDQASATAEDFVVQRGKALVVDLAEAKRRGKLHLVKKITPTRYGLAVELHDAQAALVHLGRHHKLFTDRVEVNDWREELSRNGIDAAAAFERMVAAAATAIARPDDGRGGGGGPAPGAAEDPAAA